MPSAVVFNRYAAIAERAAAEVELAIIETSTLIERDVKGDGPHAAPIRTGNLRRSYHQDRAGLKNPLEPSVEVGNDLDVAEYAIYVEYGTSRMAAQPHLTPAAEGQRGPHALRVAAAVAKASGLGAASTLAGLAGGASGSGAHPLGGSGG